MEAFEKWWEKNHSGLLSTVAYHKTPEYKVAQAAWQVATERAAGIAEEMGCIEDGCHQEMHSRECPIEIATKIREGE